MVGQGRRMKAGRTIGAALIGGFGLIAAAECLLFAGPASGYVGLAPAVAAHLVLIALLAARLHHTAVEDWGLWIMGLTVTALAGPLGAIGTLAVAAICKWTTPSQGLLEDWYRRMSGDDAADAATLLREAIQTDRALQPGSWAIRRFPEVIRHGTLSEKQTLLGLIGLKYHKSYFPILTMALRSPQPSVRAQAAAVFVKLKEKHEKRLAEALSHRRSDDVAETAAERQARAGVILTCAESGFIEASEVRQASEAAFLICADAAGDGFAEPGDSARAALSDAEDLIGRIGAGPAALTPDLKLMLANSLIRLGRHRDLHRLLMTPSGAAGARPGAARSIGAPAGGII
jgi:hypothetical protein